MGRCRWERGRCSAATLDAGLGGVATLRWEGAWEGRLRTAAGDAATELESSSGRAKVENDATSTTVRDGSRTTTVCLKSRRSRGERNLAVTDNDDVLKWGGGPTSGGE